MPTIKDDILEFDESDGEIHTMYDCDNLEYKVHENDINDAKKHFQRKWEDHLETHVRQMWKHMLEYVSKAALPILDNVEYSDFIHFIQRHSVKYPTEW